MNLYELAKERKKEVVTKYGGRNLSRMLNISHPAVSKWASAAIKIPYRNPLTGKHTIYVPDFFIVYATQKGKQRVELIEVKPSNQAVKERLGRSKHNQAAWIVNQAKWEAARAYCKQNGIFFRIVTEEDIFHTGGKKRR